jgi:hypothetical protein
MTSSSWVSVGAAPRTIHYFSQFARVAAVSRWTGYGRLGLSWSNIPHTDKMLAYMVGTNTSIALQVSLRQQNRRI